MIAPKQIVEIIQALPLSDSSIRFLVSLAESAFKYGDLTQKQAEALQRIVDTKREQGVLA